MNKSTFFTYDNAGNITQRKESTFTLGLSDTIEKTVAGSYVYADNGVMDRLLSYNGENITYNELGNPTTYRDKELTWSFVNRLASFGDVRFKYNYAGTRLFKTVGDKTIKYYCSGSTIMCQDDGTDNLYFYYGTEGVTGFKYNGEAYHYKKDMLGNILGIYDANGQLLVKYVYDAWGNHKTFAIINGEFVDISNKKEYTVDSSLSEKLAILNPFRYRSYYFDIETGLYYLQTRYYDPETGRFISMDDISYLDSESIHGLNLYAYCTNNPVMAIDSNGHFAITLGFLIGSILIGAAFGAGISGFTAYINGERGWDLFWDFVGGGIFGAALGATVALGGAAGLAATGAKIAVGATTAVLNVSMGTALGVSIGGMAFASATKYSLDCAASERQWSIGGYLIEATQGAIQGAATFVLAYLGGKAGLFNKIGDFKGWYDFYLEYGGMNNLKMISYISNLIMGPTLSKMLLISGVGAGIRWIIDKLIPEI